MKGLNLVTFQLPQGRYHKADTITVAKLHDTLVARIIKGEDEDTSIYFNPGGWKTASTAKAMNAAIEAAGVQGTVHLRHGQLFYHRGSQVNLISASGFSGRY